MIRAAIAAVWLYEGLWCKLLGGDPRQGRIVEEVPRFGPRYGPAFLRLLGIVEVALAIWVLSGISPFLCVLAQTFLLLTLNACGILWARHLIPDPPGMLIKNVAFLLLAWVSAGLGGRG